jgi:hypothetical protein
MHGEHHLPHLIGALRATGGFAGRLNRRQQEPDERGNDRDHDEEFNERETRGRGTLTAARRTMAACFQLKTLAARSD